MTARGAVDPLDRRRGLTQSLLKATEFTSDDLARVKRAIDEIVAGNLAYRLPDGDVDDPVQELHRVINRAAEKYADIEAESRQIRKTLEGKVSLLNTINEIIRASIVCDDRELLAEYGLNTLRRLTKTDGTWLKIDCPPGECPMGLTQAMKPGVVAAGASVSDDRAGADLKVVRDQGEVRRDGDGTPGSAALAVPLRLECGVPGAIGISNACGRFDHGDAEILGHVGYALGDAIVHRCLSAEMHHVQGVLRERASSDSLTGLENRRSLMENLGALIRHSQRHRFSVALVICDLDHFKAVNDQYGHQAGDEVLVRFAAILTEVLREEDIVARYGGDEFCAVLSHATADDASQAMERVRGRLEAETFRGKDGGSFSVTATFGIAELGRETTPDAGIFAADEALFRAKAKGRNRVGV